MRGRMRALFYLRMEDGRLACPAGRDARTPFSRLGGGNFFGAALLTQFVDEFFLA
jgi:hypothetical protein